jgi:hypothetical protein
MLRRSAYALTGAAAAAAALAFGALPAAGAPGPGAEGTIRLDGPIVACDTLETVGRARFRDDLDGRQRLELRADAPDAAGLSFTVVGSDFAGPGLPADVTLDDQGKARLEVRVEPGEDGFTLGDNPNIDVQDATGAVVASTDPADCTVSTPEG